MKKSALAKKENICMGARSRAVNMIAAMGTGVGAITRKSTITTTAEANMIIADVAVITSMVSVWNLAHFFDTSPARCSCF